MSESPLNPVDQMPAEQYLRSKRGEITKEEFKDFAMWQWDERQPT